MWEKANMPISAQQLMEAGYPALSAIVMGKAGIASEADAEV